MVNIDSHKPNRQKPFGVINSSEEGKEVLRPLSWRTTALEYIGKTFGFNA